MTNLDVTVNSLVSLLGDRFVAYTLGVGTGEELDDVLNYAEISDSQKLCVQTLGSTFNVLLRDLATPPEYRLAELGELLARYHSELHASLAAGMRVLAGGKPPRTDSSDPVVRALALPVADVTPVFLLLEVMHGGIAEASERDITFHRSNVFGL